jgi:hypothetical protein
MVFHGAFRSEQHGHISIGGGRDSGRLETHILSVRQVSANT